MTLIIQTHFLLFTMYLVRNIHSSLEFTLKQMKSTAYTIKSDVDRLSDQANFKYIAVIFRMFERNIKVSIFFGVIHVGKSISSSTKCIILSALVPEFV